MSAAATAAGYLYASGRLRGRTQRDQEGEKPSPGHTEREQPRTQRPRIERPRIEKPVRVAAVPAREDQREPGVPRRTPVIQYRTRRWRPEQHDE